VIKRILTQYTIPV